jgi:hypothetical protein
MSTRAQELKVLEQRKNGAKRRAQKDPLAKPKRAAVPKREAGPVKAARRTSVRRPKIAAVRA